jgi:hypothetical protein
MAIFDEIGKRLTNAGQSVVKGTKDFADVSRLNSQISEEQRKLGQMFHQLGQQFYEQYGSSAEAPFREQCAAIEGVIRRIDGVRGEIETIRGVKRCANCGADMPAGSTFCGNCGTRAEPDRQQFTAPLQSQEPQEQAPQQTNKICANCGYESDSDAVFCMSCGQKIE